MRCIGRILSIFLPLNLVLACASAKPGKPESAPPALRETAKPPKLVVTVVIDQLPSWALDRYWDYLSPEGAMHRLARRGVFHRRARYAYAGTLTAPGHASIFTGTVPAVHGVSANEIWDRERGLQVPIVDDGKHAVLGHPGHFASPTLLKAPTLADALKAATQGKGKVVSLSMKARAAVVSAGRGADLALWYDRDQGMFTSSTFYAKALPEWLPRWSQEHPVGNYLRKWEPHDPQWLREHVGEDSSIGEENWKGFGTTFPHDPRESHHPNETFTVTPASTELLLQLAAECVERMELGRDEVPDLLQVSISGTDYVGHLFGPESWEYVDNLRRVDESLGAFLQALEAKTSVAVLLTSDHGVAPLPESSRRRGHASGRIRSESVARILDAELQGVLGRGPWVEAFVHPFVYLHANARKDGVREKVVAAALDRLASLSSVHSVADTRAAQGWKEDADPLRRAIHLSVNPQAFGEIFLVPQPFFVVRDERGGTSHGTPWRYDQQVPVFFAAAGVAPLSTDEALEQSQTAATLAKILGIEAPKQANPKILPGL